MNRVSRTLIVSRSLICALTIAGCSAPVSLGDTLDVVAPKDCGLGCDDNDLCTDDRCDETTGQCVFVPRNPEGACRFDSHCDDHDPCTIDRCSVDDCDLQRCEHEAVPACRPCDPATAGGCDDLDPCTVDECNTLGVCEHNAQAFCAPGCRQSPGELWLARPGPVLVRAIASAQPDRCNPTDLQCACTVEMELVDRAVHVRVSGLGEAWECDLAGECDGNPSAACRPVPQGREVVVWGEALPGDPIPGHTDGVGEIVADGWCLSTRTEAMVGDYDATFTLNGQQTIALGAHCTETGWDFDGDTFDPSSVGLSSSTGALTGLLRHMAHTYFVRLYSGRGAYEGPVYQHVAGTAADDIGADGPVGSMRLVPR